MSKKRVLFALVALPVLLLVMVIVIGEWRRAKASPETRQQFMEREVKHTIRITSALRAYADAHGGALPGSLDDLVAAKLLEPQDLALDLMDGRPPVRWIYLGHEPHTISSPMVLSPPLSNDAGKVRRLFRGMIGAPPMPENNEWWIVACLDGSAQAFSQPKLKSTAKVYGFELPAAALPKSASEK